MHGKSTASYSPTKPAAICLIELCTTASSVSSETSAHRPRASGLPSIRFHDLRHTFAVASIKSGDDIKTVQENLGHATAAFTLDVYGHVTKQMKQDSAERMEQFIKSVSDA